MSRQAGMIDEATFARGLSLLGLTPAEFHYPLEATTREEAERRLADMKAHGKRLFRQRALELHPDRTGGDPEKTERFKLLSSTMEALEALRLPAPEPPVQVFHPTMVRVVFHSFHNGGGWTSASSSSTTTANGWPWDDPTGGW